MEHIFVVAEFWVRKRRKTVPQRFELVLAFREKLIGRTEKNLRIRGNWTNPWDLFYTFKKENGVTREIQVFPDSS